MGDLRHRLTSTIAEFDEDRSSGSDGRAWEATEPVVALLRTGSHRDPRAPATTLGDDLDAAHALLEAAKSLVASRADEARGDLASILAELDRVASVVREIREEVACDRCGAYSNDGEGFDGLCGSCADADEDGRGGRVDDAWPTIGDAVSMPIMGSDVAIRIATVHEIQPNLAAGVWAVTAEDGGTHLIEDDGDGWSTARGFDLVEPGAPAPRSYDALFLEDGVDDGDGLPPRSWRGLLMADGAQVASTDLLHATAQEACLAALDLDPTLAAAA